MSVLCWRPLAVFFAMAAARWAVAAEPPLDLPFPYDLRIHPLPDQVGEVPYHRVSTLKHDTTMGLL